MRDVNILETGRYRVTMGTKLMICKFKNEPNPSEAKQSPAAMSARPDLLERICDI